MSSRAAAEMIGALGVIVGLAFVGYQIRESAIATRAATVLELKQTWVELNVDIATNPELSQALLRGYSSGDLNSQFRLQAFHRALFYALSNAYSQYLLGTLDPEEWLPHLRDAAELSINPDI